MKATQLAAQLYTIRDYIKDAADIPGSLKKVKAAGYDAVQISGMGPIDEAELVKICNDLGLTICATHENAKVIVDEPEKIVERLNKLGCKYTAYAYPHVPLDSAQAVRDLAKKLDRSGAVLREAGQVLMYHNHHIEFKKFDGKLALDIFYDETDPQNLQGEIDTYWVQAGGGNPVNWIKRLKNRLPVLHLKGYGMTPETQPAIMEVGPDNLDWPAIDAAAIEAGCEWFVVEQDTNWTDNDPFKSLEISAKYIKETLCT